VEASIEEMTSLFEERQYKDVVKKGKNILALNPMSASLVLVYFMLAESYYQLNELDNCMEMAKVLTQQYPEHEKTGWVLLRVGLFLQEKNRVDEAQNMFTLVAYAFEQDKQLVEQAKKLKSNLGGAQ
jgi:TolA-binding protein